MGVVDFEEDLRGESEPALIVDVAGFEGPLDLLLDLARRQKVDLREISVLALAEQYLAFIESARTMRLELAADYLVMAAWLAFLKSRLLLPAPPKPDGASAVELAGALALRLSRLAAIRRAAERLAQGRQLGRDVFARGAAERPARPDEPVRFTATLYDLLDAYAARRRRQAAAHVTLAKRRVWTLADARAVLERLVGQTGEWNDLDRYLLAYAVEPGMRRTALASMLSAALEMVREGRASIRQDAAFAPVMLRVATLAPGAAS